MVSSKTLVFLALAIILGAEARDTREGYRSRGGPGSHGGHKGHGG